MKNPFLRFALPVLFLGVLIFLGCNEDPMVDDPTIEDPIDTIPDITPYTLLLEQPVDTMLAYDCCAEFSWHSDAPGPSRFQLRTNADFDDRYYNEFLDTTLEAHSFSYPQSLIPNATYRWTVQIDTLVATASFTTEDVLYPYEGSYNIEISSANWTDGLPGPLNDTTYQSTISIAPAEDGQVYVTISYFNPKYYYFNYINDHELSYYLPGDGANYASFKIDMQTDSIFGGGSAGSLGGGFLWDFRGKKE